MRQREHRLVACRMGLSQLSGLPRDGGLELPTLAPHRLDPADPTWLYRATRLAEFTGLSMILAYTTVNRLETARDIAKHLLEQRLAACVNILPGVESHYCWDNEANEERQLCQDQEHVLLIKTTTDHIQALESAIKEVHPYEMPCFMHWPCSASTGFEAWIQGEINPLSH